MATTSSVDSQSNSPRLSSMWAHENQSRTELIPASVISSASVSSNDRCGTTPIVRAGSTSESWTTSPIGRRHEYRQGDERRKPESIRPAGIHR